jgi:hypothetical protein
MCEVKEDRELLLRLLRRIIHWGGADTAFMLWCQLLGHANAESMFDRAPARACVGTYMQKCGTRFVLGTLHP